MAAKIINSLQLGATIEEVVAQVGAPLSQTTEENFIVYWYGSKVPGKSENLYFLNNILYAKGWYIKEQKKELQTFIDQYGQPAKSYLLTGSETQNSLLQTIHVWPEKGTSVLTIGSAPDSIVERQFEFKASSLEEYLTTWKVEKVEQLTIAITAAPSPIPAEEAVYTTTPVDKTLFPFLPEGSALFMLGGVIIAVVLFVIGLTLLLRKKRAHTISVAQSQVRTSTAIPAMQQPLNTPLPVTPSLPKPPPSVTIEPLRTDENTQQPPV
jgi:hypothetical protein